MIFRGMFCFKIDGSANLAPVVIYIPIAVLLSVDSCVIAVSIPSLFHFMSLWYLSRIGGVGVFVYGF